MSDLKFEQKRSLSRLEAADQLTALAAALRKGGEVDLELGAGTLSLRIPEDLRSEIEIEIGDGEIELEIEFKWPTSPRRKAPSQVAAAPAKAPTPKTTPTAKAGPGSTATGGKNTKRSATRTS
ncbi:MULTISPECIES: amphi-Trp domain-containing protein [unclassified Streptomyces]|uniref:amphi-Trp domain-containing protein n=1 Tax=unclassified Streptomyces TaxID=2593676 RepID=UPI0022719CD1|nr:MULTISPECIES: amphi-Trp domain-containing protein [unclassified Streptomyces]MCY0922644.1 amphi-Trp domain-containing protein [Streptomyces sp. H27-G5]MCY0956797.1 amphi-Trp domain-containing protein [Streptomyces sp. H27-H5]